MPTVLLPEMSVSLEVSRPAVGMLVTVYALTVAVTSIPLIRLTRSWPRTCSSRRRLGAATDRSPTTRSVPT
jgi:predicted MFS family arabinose efflux permease